LRGWAQRSAMPSSTQATRSANAARSETSAGRRPRLLLLITLAEVGGAQTYLIALLPALTERFEVTVAAFGAGPLRDAAVGVGARWVPLRHMRRPLNLCRDPLGLIELIRLMRRHRPEIVHASSSKAGILGRLAASVAGVPIRIFTVHGWAFAAYRGAPGRLYRWAERCMAPLTTATICVAEYERRVGIAARACRAERTVVIPNAVDVGAFVRAAAGDGPVELISVGRLRPPKDFITLARALAGLPAHSYRASLVGDGPDRPAIEAELKRLALTQSVRLLGDRSDVPELLAASNIFVCSSRSEGMPVSILEAMAVGLPVVASAVGGVPEIVDHGQTGLLVAPGRVDELTDALDQLIGDREQRETMGRAAWAMARERYDLPRFRRAHLELYERLLAERGIPKRNAR
jgi:glycosyltransferase involved in cell wall biosynthesis